MAMIRRDALQKEYDVIVVGSGAAGGQTAYTLTMDGAKVLMLEAGRNYVPETETPMFHTPDQAPLRGTSTPDKEFGFYDSTVDGGWQIPGEPYSSASERNRAAVLVVACAHARRTHESLGPHFAAQRSVRFQAALARRARASTGRSTTTTSRRTTTKSKC